MEGSGPGPAARRARRRTTLALLAIAAGCGESGGDATVHEDRGSANAVRPGPFTTEAVDRPRPGAPVAVLRAVRTAAHPAFDRVVLEFAAALPGYRVEYADGGVVHCGSGEPASVAGPHVVRIRLEPANAHTEEGMPTVAERARRPALPVLRSLVLTCDFEAHVEWAAGLESRGGFRVLELRDPPRLVVDFRE